MFLTPDGAPFFGGTYFPKEPRYNLPGFPQLLERVAQIYRENREEIGRQNETILATFENMHPGTPAHHSELSPEPIAAALRGLKTNFDSRYGGFGGGARFSLPPPGRLLTPACSPARRRAATAGASPSAPARRARGGCCPHRGRGCRLSPG